MTQRSRERHNVRVWFLYTCLVIASVICGFVFGVGFWFGFMLAVMICTLAFGLDKNGHMYR